MHTILSIYDYCLLVALSCSFLHFLALCLRADTAPAILEHATTLNLYVSSRKEEHKDNRNLNPWLPKNQNASIELPSSKWLLLRVTISTFRPLLFEFSIVNNQM